MSTKLYSFVFWLQRHFTWSIRPRFYCSFKEIYKTLQLSVYPIHVAFRIDVHLLLCCCTRSTGQIYDKGIVKSCKLNSLRKTLNCPTNGVLALAGEALTFDGSGDMVFRSNGTLWGRGGKGDFDVVAMFGLSNHSARLNLRKCSEKPSVSD